MLSHPGQDAKPRPSGGCKLEMYTADDATAWHLRADLAIVGSGGGGLVAAIAAARRGSRVVLLERAKDLGGSLTRSRGMIPAAGTRFQREAGIQDGPEAFANDILAQNPSAGDPAHILAMCRAATQLVEWLVDSGITRLNFVPTLVASGHVAPRMHGHAVGTGPELTADLVRAATKNPHVTVRTASVAEDLWADHSGSIVGIAAREKRGPANISAERVLLACGGFAANNDLVAEHQGDISGIPYAGVPGALGDALRWGAALGAATAHLDACYVTPFATTPGGLVIPDTLVRDGAIVVDQFGRRFVNESAAPLAVARAVLAQPGRVAYLIFDERIYRAAREADPYFARLIVPRAVRRDTNPADLARHFEIDADNLLPTLKSFYTDIVHRADPFGRSEGGPPFSPPFYGVRITPVRVRTLGGLCITDMAQVIRTDGTPIANLHASGGVVAHVSRTAAHSHSLGDDTLTSLVWGWIAGRASQPQETT